MVEKVDKGDKITMVKFNRVEEEKTFDNAESLGVGTHLVQTKKMIEKDNFIDKNGNIYTIIVFANKDGAEHGEPFFWGGSMAHKTGRYLRAIGELKADEKIEDLEKQGREITSNDVEGSYLYITIEEDTKATNPKYKFKIANDGFAPYENTPVEPKKAPKKNPFED